MILKRVVLPFQCFQAKRYEDRIEDWYSNTYVLTHVNKIKLEYVVSATSNVDTQEKEKSRTNFLLLLVFEYCSTITWSLDTKFEWVIRLRMHVVAIVRDKTDEHM